jgi:hypothetical protein
MGVFSRTMLMLTMAWLIGLVVTFFFLSASDEPSWRDKFVAEANIRRAIAYRTVDIQGGIVAERGHDKGPNTASRNQSLQAESIGHAPGASGSNDPLPGARISDDQSLIRLEESVGTQLNSQLDAARARTEAEIAQLQTEIATALRDRRAADTKLAQVREASRIFAAQMQSYRYIINSFQQKIFNLDIEIKRILIEKDALTAELAQIRNDIRRIEGQQHTLEDSYYELAKGYERTIRVLAWYEQADPDLRRLADTAGRGWLRGKVISVGPDPRTGVVSISLGSHEGVFVGQTFTIYRNEQFVARMVVESVRPNVSMGRLERDFRGRAFVTEGDGVKTAEPFGGATLRR